jgi:phosphopantothenate---cysteine ligase (CTP)
MRILVTAGNTQTPIDRVRCLTNIFTGRTGGSIAVEAYQRGHHVTLATSHPDVIPEKFDPARWQCHAYRTFAELEALMARHIVNAELDVVVHCAAINDYESGGIFAPAPGTAFEEQSLTWIGAGKMIDRAAGKVKSDEPELWLRLIRAPKLVDKIRSEWGFRGTLVKFKLEVGVNEEALLTIAEKSRLASQANWMVANTLEGAAEWAFLGGEGGYTKLPRPELPATLMDAIEGKATHG